MLWTASGQVFGFHCYTTTTLPKASISFLHLMIGKTPLKRKTKPWTLVYDRHSAVGGSSWTSPLTCMRTHGILWLDTWTDVTTTTKTW